MVDLSEASNVETIRKLNDEFRRTFAGGKIMLTPGVSNLDATSMELALARLKTFNSFAPDNDPYSEHDFGAFEIPGQKLFFKIDYYDPGLEFGSEDPADPSKTTRVLTLMLAEEY